MKRVFVFLLVCTCQLNYAQGAEYNDVYPPDVISPKFNNGGLDKFYEFINKNFNFSKVTKPGKMITTFTVDELGEVKNIRVVQFVDIESATEIIRVLKNAPKWEPALRGGKPFSVAIKFPLTFKEKETQVTTIVKTSKNESITKEKEIVEDNNMYNASGVEVRPEFQGGISAFYKFIGANYKTPDVAGLKGKLLISFIVDKDGSITDIKVLRDIGYGTGEEAVRVLKLSPKWIPAEQNGQPVRCAYMLPINIETTK